MAALLLVVAVVGLRAWQAASALRHAEARVPLLREALVDGDTGAVDAHLAALQQDTGTAVARTSGPAWRLVSAVPYAGRTPRATAGLARAVDDLAREVLPPLAETAADLTPERLRPEGDRLDLDLIAATAPVLAAQELRVVRVQEQLDRLPTSLVAGPVAAAHRELDTQVDELADLLGTVASASAALPGALGADGPRHWFVALQTNAESRGTGGLVGAYAVLTTDGGRLALTQLGSNLELEDLPGTPVEFGPDYRALYGLDPALWSGTNLSPHFPYAAQLWLQKWEAQTGQRLDGALATDPVALARVLQATGPLELADGGTLTADDAVELTERDAYVQFGGDEEARKEFLVGIVRTVVERLLTPEDGDGVALAEALADVAVDGRLLAWSTRPQEQAVLARLPLAGTTPDGDGPYAGVFLNNGGGNKLDYYLGRAVDYELDACVDGRRRTRIAVRLDNDVPVDVPQYVAGGEEAPAVIGTHRVIVAVHTTRGAVLEGATLDGTPVGVFTGREQGRPVLVLTVDLAPRQEREVVLHLDEPAVDGEPTVAEQPLARDQETSVRAAPCAREG